MTEPSGPEITGEQSRLTPLGISLAPALRIALYTAVALAVVGYGAVDTLVFLLAAFIIFSVWLAASATISVPPFLTPSHSAINWAIVGILIIASLQIVPLFPGPWTMLDLPLPEFAAGTRHAISIDPSTTVASVLSILAPLAAMSASLLLHQDEIKAARFLRRGAFVGGLIIGLTLIQFMIAPDTLLLDAKQYYRDSFTATFVNRNTAATFCGIVTVVTLVFALDDLAAKQGRQSQRATLVSSSSWSGSALWLLLCVAAVGLALTKSRAGVSATLLPILGIVLLHGYETMHARKLTLGLAARVAIVIAAAFAGGSLLLDQVLVRFETLGADNARWCVYGTMLSAVSERPWLGIGLGGFQTFYPLRRDPNCGIYGAWEYLHSVYLETLLSGGFVLFALALCGIAWLGRLFIIGYRRRRSFRSVPLAAGSTLLLVCLHSVFDFSVQIPGIAILSCAIMGAAIPASAAPRRGKSRAESNGVSSRAPAN